MIGVAKYYSRMSRPLYTGGWSWKQDDLHGPLYVETEKGLRGPPCEEGALADGLNQVATLMNMLTGIFETLTPDAANLESYGHTIGNALLLACIDFENECKGRITRQWFPAAKQVQYQHLREGDWSTAPQ